VPLRATVEHVDYQRGIAHNLGISSGPAPEEHIPLRVATTNKNKDGKPLGIEKTISVVGTLFPSFRSLESGKLGGHAGLQYCKTFVINCIGQGAAGCNIVRESEIHVPQG
jgi:hypothetical protein